MKKILTSFLFICLLFAFSGCTAEQRYPSFFQDAVSLGEIPGQAEDFVPQGICRVPDAGVYLVTGYMTDSTPSPLFVVDEETGAVLRRITFAEPGGASYLGHSGGIAYARGSVWIVSSGYAWRFLYSDLSAAPDGGTLEFLDGFDTHNAASSVFAQSDGTQLIVGEFYEKDDYPTAEDHVFSSRLATYHAFACVFAIDVEAEGGVVSDTPILIFAVRDKVQGIAVTASGKIVLSVSYGRTNTSHLYVYSLPEQVEIGDFYDVGGTDVPVIALDADRLESTLALPPMSEDLEYADGSVIVLFESCAARYADTAKYVQTEIWAYPIA